jgi:hypothetical protein
MILDSIEAKAAELPVRFSVQAAAFARKFRRKVHCRPARYISSGDALSTDGHASYVFGL